MFRFDSSLKVVVAGWLSLAAIGSAETKKAQPTLRFNRDIRPILSDKCFRCHHGADASHQGNLRLDRREDAIAMRSDCRAIVPGKPEESELFRRITSSDDDIHMPPRDTNLVLTAKEIDILRRWIESGAEYEPHWSFVQPTSPPLPAVKLREWPRNPIDQFVLAELEEKGLAPSPAASLPTLVRRASLDLTGLPPTLAELDAANDYEKEIDRLLASPRLGERLALDWLDGARYADTSGYYGDNERRAWPWRDWVINAFNANMPFDQFTVDQLAGDLLPRPTQDQKIATAYNRHHMSTNESGVIEEEYRIGYVVDRVDTTTTVWLGLTIGCARCHDHKYDPITQAEYYEIFACFNNVVEKGLIKDLAGPPPLLSLPDEEQTKAMAELTRRKDENQARLKALNKHLTESMSEWEKGLTASLPPTPVANELAYFNFNADSADHGPRQLAATEQGAIELGPGVAGKAAKFESSQYVEFDDPDRFDKDAPFSLAVWIKPGSAPSGCVVSKMDSDGPARGFEIIWYKSQPRINLVHEWGKSAIEVVAKSTFPANEWRHLAITYDGSGKAAGMNIFIDGVRQELKFRRDDLKGSTASTEPWRIAWKGTGVGFEGGIDEFRLYDRALAAADVDSIYWRDLLSGAVATAAKERTKRQTEGLRSYYVAKHGTAELKNLLAESAALKTEEAKWREQIVAVPVMQEMEKPRDTNILVRGQYDLPGRKVNPGVPAILGQWPQSAPKNRLGLAQWIVAPENPLTARVIVNRYWQLIFGEGLVRTANDFGLQGEYPTHPELLDLLAVEFVKSGWDLKALLRLIVTSNAYRQSSRFTPALLASDPENRLLARGASYRLGAEQIRDQALAIGGLLVERRGGPSVKPYQPAGLWEAVSYNGDQSYQQDHGESLYRRTLYTYWKRQSPPPGVLTFDGPTRELCTVRRPRTNTPLQALALLNDVTYVEAARGLATRTLRQKSDRIAFAFRLCTGRAPTNKETASIQKLFDRQLAAYRSRPADTTELLKVGEAPIDATIDPCELAAWTTVAGVLLNLDETTRNTNPEGAGAMLFRDPIEQAITRRHFFGRAAGGIGAAALASLLQPADSVAVESVNEVAGILPATHFAPKAKRVIYLFMQGGPSQMDLFDYKPSLANRHGEDLPASIRGTQRLTGMSSSQKTLPVAPSPFKFAQHGKSGAWLSELVSHMAKACDDLCFIKSVNTEAINHDPAITFLQTGHQQPGRPSFGSWVSYGLGSETRDLPAFVVLVSRGSAVSPADPLYARLWGSAFLPSNHQGVSFRSSGDPVLYLSNPDGVTSDDRRQMLETLGELNRDRYSESLDPEVNTRIAQYETAFRMQTSVPDLTDFRDEPEETFKLYGDDAKTPGTYAANCLLARRMAERGVRFIQLYHRGWDQHYNLPTNCRLQCRDVDQASAALVLDLKRRGLLDDTLVVWGGEFGRTTYSQGKLTPTNFGRDHHGRCFTMWLAGGGVKPGISYGTTDDYCYNVASNPVHVHDLNATLLRCLGVDHTRLTFKFQGRYYRLTDVEGKVVESILA